MQRRVFLSYCRADQAAVARLRDDLMEAGFVVWWDQDIGVGQDWKLEIRQALLDADAFVICFSRNSQRRESSGIYPELGQAVSIYQELKPGQTFILPIRLSKCEIPPIELDAARYLDRLQYVDLYPASARPDGLKKLVEAVRRPS